MVGCYRVHTDVRRSQDHTGMIRSLCHRCRCSDSYIPDGSWNQICLQGILGVRGVKRQNQSSGRDDDVKSGGTLTCVTVGASPAQTTGTAARHWVTHPSVTAVTTLDTVGSEPAWRTT